MSRQAKPDVRLPEFIAVSRTTMLSVTSADGGSGPPLFVFKGSILPYRQVLSNVKEQVEAYASHSPRNATVAVRDKCGGAGSQNFL